MHEHSNDAQSVIEQTLAGVVPDQLDPTKVHHVIVPNGASSEVLDLERLLPQPRRARGKVVVHTVNAFADYVTRHDDEASTTIWVDLNAHRIVGVLNDHTGGVGDGAQWGDHRAELVLALTPEWQHWTKRDGDLMDQEDFAEHIEDGLREIVSPDGATMLEVAQSIQGTVTAEFKAATRLSNGSIGMQYVEEQAAAAGQRGDLEIPERFELAIAPFVGEHAYKIGARLRYRIRGGDLRIGYRLDRPHEVIVDALDQIAGRLSTQFTGGRVFVGVPRS